MYQLGELSITIWDTQSLSVSAHSGAMIQHMVYDGGGVRGYSVDSQRAHTHTDIKGVY